MQFYTTLYERLHIIVYNLINYNHYKEASQHKYFNSNIKANRI